MFVDGCVTSNWRLVLADWKTVSRWLVLVGFVETTNLQATNANHQSEGSCFLVAWGGATLCLEHDWKPRSKLQVLHWTWEM